MAEPVVSPVELGFSEFVSKLVADTFESVISSLYTQEENWLQLKELLSHDVEEFTSFVVDEVMLENELIRLFPDNEGGTTIVKDGKYQKSDPQQNINEEPPIQMYTGYQPITKNLSDKDVLEIKRRVKLQLGQKQYEIMNNVLARGTTKLIVDGGKINAKLNFEILQIEEENESNDSTTVADDLLNAKSRIIVKRKLPGFGGLSRPIEMKNVHFFVKPPTDSDPQTHQLKANVYGEVEIYFKTIS